MNAPSSLPQLPSSSPPTPTLPPGMYSAADLKYQVFEEPEFVLDGLLPIGISMLVSKPKVGKSWMSLQLGLALASGDSFLGQKIEPADVLYIALEDHGRRLQRRIRMLGYDFPARLAFSQDEPRLGDGLESRIETWVRAMPAPKLVIIDTMGRIDATKGSRESDYQHSTRALGGLQKLAMGLGIAILLVHHKKKDNGDSDDPFDQVHGSIGINGVMDAILVLDRPRLQGNATLTVTSRDFEERTLFLQQDPDSCTWQRIGPDIEDMLAISPERLAILKELKNGSRRTGEIATALSKSKSNVSGQLSRLLEDKLVKKVKTGMYALTDEVANLLARDGEDAEPGEAESENVDQEAEYASAEVTELELN